MVEGVEEVRGGDVFADSGGGGFLRGGRKGGGIFFNHRLSFVKRSDRVGFEPTTTRLEGGCSIR